MSGSKHFLLVMIAWLAACAQPQGGNPGGGNPGGGQCAAIVRADVTVPTRAVNGPSACDYLVDGMVNIRSTLTIEPGAVIRFTKDSSLRIEGGELIAIGTPNARITLEGQSPIQGFWDGITLSSQAGRVDLQYVDLKDAGQTCTIPYCPQGELRGYGGGSRELITNGLIINYSAVLYIAHSSFRHSSRWAISCTDEDRALVRLGPGNTFSNNAFGDVDPDCNPTNAP